VTTSAPTAEPADGALDDVEACRVECEEEDRMAQVLIIGAGMTGLAAAARLTAAGHQVQLLDKGRRHGGRLATRSVDDAVFDTGALAFPRPHDPDLATEVDTWLQRGHVVAHDGALRGSPTMRALPTALSAPFDVRLAVQVDTVRRVDDGWGVSSADGRDWTADVLLVTAPAPQALTLVRDAGVSDTTLAALARIAYAPCLAVLAVPRAGGSDRSAAVPPVGAADGVATVRDNHALGVSPVPSLTIHADATFSSEHFERPRDESGALLARRAEALLGVPLDVVHVHGWRYARPSVGHPEPVLVDDSAGAPLLIAGDAFGAPTEDAAGAIPDGVLRAMRSGRSAAGAVLALSR
jgi:renalase